MVSKFIKSFLLIIFCFSFDACHHSPKKTIQLPLVEKTKAIIFIPGFKGSTLLNQKNQIIWLSLYQLVIGSETLTIGNPELALKGPLLHAGTVLDKVMFIPLLYTKVIYAGFIANFTKDLDSSISFIPFAYDWRQSVDDNAILLGQLIDSLSADGIKNINIIGHSFGGVIAAYYLRYGSQKIETAVETWEGSKKINKIVFAGTPFRGAAEIFDEMLLGAWSGPDRSLLTADAHSSFPASYQLLPAPDDSMFLPDELLSLYDPHNWQESGWGLMKDPNSPEICMSRMKFTSLQLMRAAKLSNLINAEPAKDLKSFTSTLNILGKGRKTLTHFYWNNENSSDNLKKLSFSDGDSIVTLGSAKIPAAYNNTYSSELSVSTLHSEILSEDKTIQNIKEYLLKNDKSNSDY